jgi:hypothetical protein
MATDAEVADLKLWLRNLFDQVRQLRKYEHIWNGVQDVIHGNPAIQQPNHFYMWMQDMYVSGVAMAIRRQLDDDTRTMSSFRFLKRLKGDPSAVSRKRYRALCKDGDPVVERLKSMGLLDSTVNSTYDSLVGAGKAQPSADDIQAEIDALADVAEHFVSFANKVIAHDDQTKPTVLPTFAEVHDVITYMEKLVQRYAQLLEASHWSMDLNFAYEWKEIFRVPWIP